MYETILGKAEIVCIIANINEFTKTKNRWDRPRDVKEQILLAYTYIDILLNIKMNDSHTHTHKQ